MAIYFLITFAFGFVKEYIKYIVNIQILNQ
jgi:hypothetical protein